MARRFSAQSTTVFRELQATMRKLRATSLKVNQDLYSGTCEIVFDRAGRRYVFRCQKYRDAADNLRACQLTIGLLHRAMDEYGVTQSEQQLDRTFSQVFAGWEATPDDVVLLLGDGSEPWWQVLGVAQDALLGEVVNAFRALARVHHPDAGGDVETFVRVRRAYEAALASLRDQGKG
jgi:hypothetical protein